MERKIRMWRPPIEIQTLLEYRGTKIVKMGIYVFFGNYLQVLKILIKSKKASSTNYWQFICYNKLKAFHLLYFHFNCSARSNYEPLSSYRTRLPHAPEKLPSTKRTKKNKRLSSHILIRWSSHDLQQQRQRDLDSWFKNPIWNTRLLVACK